MTCIRISRAPFGRKQCLIIAYWLTDRNNDWTGIFFFCFEIDSMPSYQFLGSSWKKKKKSSPPSETNAQLFLKGDTDFLWALSMTCWGRVWYQLVSLLSLPLIIFCNQRHIKKAHSTGSTSASHLRWMARGFQLSTCMHIHSLVESAHGNSRVGWGNCCLVDKDCHTFRLLMSYLRCQGDFFAFLYCQRTW